MLPRSGKPRDHRQVRLAWYGSSFPRSPAHLLRRVVLRQLLGVLGEREVGGGGPAPQPHQRAVVSGGGVALGLEQAQVAGG